MSECDCCVSNSAPAPNLLAEGVVDFHFRFYKSSILHSVCIDGTVKMKGNGHLNMVDGLKIQPTVAKSAL